MHCVTVLLFCGSYETRVIHFKPITHVPELLRDFRAVFDVRCTRRGRGGSYLVAVLIGASDQECFVAQHSVISSNAIGQNRAVEMSDVRT